MRFRHIYNGSLVPFDLLKQTEPEEIPELDLILHRSNVDVCEDYNDTFYINTPLTPDCDR